MVEQRQVYVGNRYVPKIMGEWNQLESYEGLSIVTNEGNSYTSKKRVPVGVDLSNETYWVSTGNYNAQIENYRNEVKEISLTLDEKIKKGDYFINVKDFGAKGDNSTDDTSSIKQALNYLTTNGIGELFFPKGTYLVSESIELNHLQNGLKISGVGYQSQLKIKDNTLTSESSKFHLFHLRDSSQSIENISFTDLSFNGNKENNLLKESIGLTIYETSKIFYGIKLNNLWFENFGSDGNFIYASNVTISNIHSKNNIGHGLGIGGGTGVVATNIVCESNGQYGLDIHGGNVTVDNFSFSKNTTGGFKTSTGKPNAILTNGFIFNNEGTAVTQTGEFENLLIDNVVSMNNKAGGFVFREKGMVNIGKIVSINDNLLENLNIGGVTFINGNIVKAESIIVKGSKTEGIFVGQGGRQTIDYVNIEKCLKEGIKTEYVENLVIKSGSIKNNKNYGITSNGGKIHTFRDLILTDDQTIKTQTTGIKIGCENILLDRIDFTGSTIPYEISTNLIKKFNQCIGVKSENGGVKTFSGDGTTKQFTWQHNLHVTPRILQVTPFYSTMSNLSFAVMVSDTTVTITFNTPPDVGVDNIRFNWYAEI